MLLNLQLRVMSLLDLSCSMASIHRLRVRPSLSGLTSCQLNSVWYRSLRSFVSRGGSRQVLHIVLVTLDVSFQLRQREVVWIKGEEGQMLKGSRQYLFEPILAEGPGSR